MRTSRSLRLGSIAIVVGLVAAACHSGGTTHPNASGSPHAGGVYRTAVEDFGFTGAFDPTGEYVQTGWAILNQLLLRNLVNYRHIAGGAGNWGSIPMVPNERLTLAEARTMARSILALRP